MVNIWFVRRSRKVKTGPAPLSVFPIQPQIWVRKFQRQKSQRGGGSYFVFTPSPILSPPQRWAAGTCLQLVDRCPIFPPADQHPSFLRVTLCDYKFPWTNKAGQSFIFPHCGPAAPHALDKISKAILMSYDFHHLSKVTVPSHVLTSGGSVPSQS